MMASNMISRLLPIGIGSPSIYDTIREHDQDSEASDAEERAGLALDEENLQQNLFDLDLEGAHLPASEITARSNANQSRTQELDRGKRKGPVKASRPRWMQETHKHLEADEADDEVPASLLFEGGADVPGPRAPNLPPAHELHNEAIPVAGPATRRARLQWEATQARQGLHPRTRPTVPGPGKSSKGLPGLTLADANQKAMWRWANVRNLDNFLEDVYLYFIGNGIWSILLQRFLNLLTLGFVVGFTVFLSSCIDYRSLRGSTKMSEILISTCSSKMSTLTTFVLWLTSFFWIAKFFQYLLDIRRLSHMHDFYHHLLGIPDVDIQTISWQEVVSRLMALRDANPSTAAMVSSKSRRFLGSQSKQRMDAHDIANRLMRKENYLIAMFNKEVFDFSLPVPFLRNRQFYSRTLEWNIQQCVLDYVFDERGQVRQLFLKETHRKALSDGLTRRFRFAATLSVFISPFIVVYFLMYYFLQYFNEYQKNPSQIGSRQYNALAEWKFREFNELWHLFQRRINMSYPFASRYINQFPKDKTVQAARFVAFIAGALASVLALVSFIDPELFLGFEITPDRTVLFYIGIFGTVWAVARGLLPEENVVFEPSFAIEEVIDFTHYKPAHWDGRLHSDDVRRDFACLYQMKLVIFLEEIFSMIFTPFVLWFSLPQCSDRIIDFFREFTVHVDGLGYVCSFAEFNFRKHSNAVERAGLANRQSTDPASNATTTLRDDYYTAKDQKLEASYWGFMNDYARNPKTDIRFPYPHTRRRINPPPPIPGPMSPTVLAEMNSLGVTTTGRQDRWDRSMVVRPMALGAAGFQSSAAGTPGFAAAAAAAAAAAQTPGSPLTSMLLDPHHQPSSSGFHSLAMAQSPPPVHSTALSRYRPRRQPVDRPIEAGDMRGEGGGGAVISPGTKSPRTTARGGRTGGVLESSWKMEQEGLEEEEEEEEDVDTVTGDKGGGGVLGFIRQFQKAQGQGRAGGGGVPIGVGL